MKKREGERKREKVREQNKLNELSPITGSPFFGGLSLKKCW